MRNVSVKSVAKMATNILCSRTLYENDTVYKKM